MRKVILKFSLLVVGGLLISSGVCFGDEKHLAAGTKEVSLERIVATVNGKPITKDTLYVKLLMAAPKTVNAVLMQIINRILIFDEADKRKIEITDKEFKEHTEGLGIREEVSVAQEEIIKAILLLEKMIIKEKGIKVKKDEIEKYFKDNKEKFIESEQVNISHILVGTEEEANDILIALNAGADFAIMAKAKSMDPASKDRGGEVGFFSRGMLIPDIEKIAFNLKVGEISEPLKTLRGYSIIKLDERKEAKELKLDREMKERIKKLIIQEKVKENQDEWLDELRSKAEIVIH